MEPLHEKRFTLLQATDHPLLAMAAHRRAPTRSSPDRNDRSLTDYHSHFQRKSGPANVTWGATLNERRKRTGWAFGKGGGCATGHVTVRSDTFDLDGAADELRRGLVAVEDLDKTEELAGETCNAGPARHVVTLSSRYG